MCFNSRNLVVVKSFVSRNLTKFVCKFPGIIRNAMSKKSKKSSFVLKCSINPKASCSDYTSPAIYRNFVINDTIHSPNNVDTITSSQEMSLTRLAPKENEKQKPKTPTNRDLLDVEKVLLRNSSLCRQVLKQFSQVKSTSTRTTYNSDMEQTRMHLPRYFSDYKKYDESNKENAGKKRVEKGNAKKQLFNQKKIDPNAIVSKSQAKSQEKSKSNKEQEKLEFSIACTRVGNNQYRFLKDTIATLGRCSLDKSVTSRTTHLVAGESERTINMLRAIARGLWIVSFDWITKSFEAQTWLVEDDFEIKDFSIAVTKCRVERQTFGSPYKVRLFDDVGSIYVCKNCTPKRRLLEELIVLCDGKIVRCVEDAVVIIGDEFLERDLQATHLKETWILDSITKKKVQVTKKYRLKNDFN